MGMIWSTSGLKKFDIDEYYLFSRIGYPDVGCHFGIQLWFGFQLIFFPSALIFSIWIWKLSYNNYDVKEYKLLGFRFIIYSNSNFKINGSVLFIDVVNLIWAIIGQILNFILGKS